MRFVSLQSDILRFIIDNGYRPGDQMPTIQEISQLMGVSVAKTREALEIARALGAVEIKPGRGTRVTEFDFSPAFTLAALYGIGIDGANFEHLRDLRNAVETQFWDEAVIRLTAEDVKHLHDLLDAANRQLERQPIQVPAREHRDLHMTIFSRLENPFVRGVLESFWEAYEAFGLNLYRDLSYHRTVWSYHEQIVDAIEAGDAETGRRLLVEHMNLLNSRQPDSATTNGSNSRPHSFE